MTHGDDGDTTPKATTMKASAAKAKATGAADDGAGGGDGDEPTPTMPKLPRSRRAGGRAQRRASAPTIDPGSNHYIESDLGDRAVSINDFELIHMLGSGGVGNVWYGVERRSRRPYAVKIIEKHQIMGQTSLARVLAEREIMTMLKHPFIVNLHYAMQDDTRIFFVLDYMR